jgi:hypothetical protein
MTGPILLALRAALVLLLYSFLILAFYFLWLSLKKESLSLSAEKTPTLQVTRILDGQMISARYNTPEVYIGRDPACDIHLEELTISARHARLSFRQKQWWIEDLKSTNGTLLNLDPVVEPVVVTDGDELQCGAVTFLLSFESSKPDDQ